MYLMLCHFLRWRGWCDEGLIDGVLDPVRGRFVGRGHGRGEAVEWTHQFPCTVKVRLLERDYNKTVELNGQFTRYTNPE
jgi:hypothetical protein